MSGSRADKITYKRRAYTMVGMIVTVFVGSVVTVVLASQAVGLV